MSGPTFLAKGTHVIQAAEWINERLGAGAFQSMVARAGDEWATPMPMHWYDLDVLLHVITETARRLSMTVESVTAEISRRNAQRDLTTVYRVFLRVLRPSVVLGFMPRMWETYFRFGAVKVVTNEPGLFVLVTSGIPTRFLGWLRGGWVGFLPETIRVAGGRDVALRMDEPEPDGQGHHRVRVHATYRR